MVAQSIASGGRLVAAKPGLTLLIYLVNLIAALVLSLPIYGALVGATASSGYAADLVQRFDLVLWADIMQKSGDVLIASWGQLFWMIPLFLLWKVVVSVGLINGLRDGGARSFWDGVGRFTGKATLLALLYLLTLLGWLVVVGIMVVVARLVFSNIESVFTLYWIVTPAVLFVGLAILDMMHDFGRISLVISGRSAPSAWLDGIRYPFRRPSSVLVYLMWLLVAIVLSVAAVRMHASFAATIGVVWLLFLVQQIVFFLRAGVTVAWFGSEVSYFERVQYREAPLIADAPAASEENTGFDPLTA
ncbi:MAG: hypothetical protein HKN37_00865 [Rhodothermales bacterium]|nr:hypothetical protein [Rhodothermales bacterium]